LDLTTVSPPELGPGDVLVAVPAAAFTPGELDVSAAADAINAEERGLVHGELVLRQTDTCPLRVTYGNR
jgi:NADPH:quinone reductase-like Zn-dependent oxidoreductase